MRRFQSSLGLCPADKPPPQLISVSLPDKKAIVMVEQPPQSRFQMNRAVLEVPWLQPPKPAPTLPSTAGVPRSHSSYCTVPRAPSSTRRQQEGFGLAVVPLTSDTRCRFLLAMTVRQPCLRGRGS